MPDILAASEPKAVVPGQVVVNTGTGVWKTWANASNLTGAIVGVVLIGNLPGNSITVTTVGRFPYTSFNLGGGNPGPIIAGNTPSRGTVGTGLGICGADGELFIYPSQVGVAPPAVDIPSVTNIAGLRLTGATAAGAIEVLGYSIAGDGGGGTFVWNATDTRADDGGTIIGSGTTGRWNRVYTQVLDVRWFGAIADGQRITNASMTNNTSVVRGTFPTTPVVGQLASIYTPGSFTVYNGTITAVGTNQFTATFTLPAGPDIAANGILVYGSDNFTALSNAFAATIENNVQGHSTGEDIYVPPGIYCVSAGFSLGGGYATGIGLRGGYSSIGNTTPVTQTRIILMNSAAYLLQIHTGAIRMADIILDGNRLATDTYQLLSNNNESTVNLTHDRCRFSGGNQTIINFTGSGSPPGEIDHCTFRACRAEGDGADLTYRPGAIIKNLNAEAFLIDWHGGIIQGGAILCQFQGGSINFYGNPKFFFWNQTAFDIIDYAAEFVIENAYNEIDTGRFMQVRSASGVQALGTVTLRNCILQFCPIYTAHTMRVVVEDCLLQSNVYSDPAAATSALSGDAVGHQYLDLVRTQFDGGAAVVYMSGVPGQYVRIKDCTFAGFGETNAAINATANSATFAANNVLTQQHVGCPIQIPGAGPGGLTYFGWIQSVANANSGTLASVTQVLPQSNVTNANSIIGNTGTWDGTRYAIPWSDASSPGELVQDSSTLSYGLTGTATLTNGSANVVFSQAQSLPSGTKLTFSAQAGVTYTLANIVNNNANAVLTSNFNTNSSNTSSASIVLTYDAANLSLGPGISPAESGILLPADYHRITVLTSDRTYQLSSLHVHNGMRMRVENDSTHIITLQYTGTTIAVLQPNQWVELEFAPNSGWVVFSTNSRGKTVASISNVAILNTAQGIVATCTLTPLKSNNISIIATFGPAPNVTWNGGGNVQLFYAPNANAGLPNSTAIATIAASTASPNLSAFGITGLATNLNVGTAYDFYLVVNPTNGNFVSGAGAKGGITVWEVT